MTLTVLRTTPERWREYRDYLRSRIPSGTLVLNDEGREGARAQFLKALRLAGPEPVLLLEDDIILCPDFERRVEAVIATHGHAPIQFFSRGRRDAELGSRWRPGSTFSMNQCHYLPAGMAAGIVDYFADWPRRAKTVSACDWLVADFLSRSRSRYWLHVPSLVDHRVGVSAIDSRRPKSRKSSTFETTDWGLQP